MDIRYIDDTLTFGKNKPVHWYREPDLRLAIKIETDNDGSIKLSFNQMHQNIFMLNSNISVPRIRSGSSPIIICFRQKVIRFQLVYSEVFQKEDWKHRQKFFISVLTITLNLKTELIFWKILWWKLQYYRETRKPMELRFTLNGADANWKDGFHTHIPGLWFRSMESIRGTKSIMGGFPSNYDIPHSLNAVLNYYLTRRVIFSSILTYQTGKPITYPESVYYVNGTPYLDYSKRNAYRIPTISGQIFPWWLKATLKRISFCIAPWSWTYTMLPGVWIHTLYIIIQKMVK